MDDDLILEFATDSLEHIAEVEPLLLRMESDANVEGEEMNSIFRAVHSIKGAAGFLGLESIGRISHVSETLLMKLRDGEIRFHSGMVDPLLRVVDVLRTMLEGLPGEEGECPEDLVRDIKLLAAETGTNEGREQSETAAETVVEEGHDASPTRKFGQVARGLGYLDQSQVDAILEIQAAETPHRSFGAVGLAHGLLTEQQITCIRSEQTTLLAIAHAKQTHAAEETEAPAAKGKGRRSETIRVSVQLLDNLMDLAGELVLGRNQLMQVAETVKHSGVRRVLREVDHVTTQLQEHIMHTRMQPMRVLFDRIPRQVRDIASKLGKEIELEFVGKDVELDRTILEALGDPMTHLVRNSLDHGIEKPDERMANGKPRKGHLTLRSYHAGGQVIVEIEDDGKGIDHQRLRDVAVERGLSTPEKIAAMPDSEAVKLIFHAGLSTADEVTDVSGRGVGMDVVRTNIQSLGGQIDIRSTTGVGTTITIKLPLTLAIIPALTVSIGDERFAIPQVSMAEIVRVWDEELERRTEIVRGVEVFRLRNQLLPLVRLGACLGMDVTRVDAGPRKQSVIVLKAGSQRYGLVVDDLHNNEEIVVKPLSEYYKGCSWYAGATILGDGKVVMILDAIGLLSKSGLHLEDIEEEASRYLDASHSGDEGEKRALLLFMNAKTEQFAVALDQLLRLESIEASSIERVGQKEFLQHRGESIPLIRLESVLPVKPSSSDSDELFVLIPRSDGPPVGIIVTQIIDTVETTKQPDPAHIACPGLSGSAIIEGRMTLFLDPEALLTATGVNS